jgi:tRNA (cytidine/uridine-2'-O-)-methyltransferase
MGLLRIQCGNRNHENDLPDPFPKNFVTRSGDFVFACPAVPYEPQLHVVLFQPEIHYNTGNIGRTCVAVGAKLWLVKPLGFSTDDSYLRRAGLDYWELLEWEVVENWAALIERLPVETHWYFTKKSTKSYLDASYKPGAVLVFGSESQGLPEEVLWRPERCLRIPMRSEVRCLNLSNAAALACYEAIRQWGGLDDAGIADSEGLSS